MNTTVPLNPSALAALATLGTTITPEDPTPAQDVMSQVETLSEQVTGAFAVALAYLTQIQDPTYRQNVEEKLARSNVRGSMVMGINGHDDVAKMLSSVTDWEEIIANLPDKEIRVLQGELPDRYKAFAAYATVEEIDRMFGKDGLASIDTKRGYQKEGEYYRCTQQRMPTRVITVQLKKDLSEVEHVHQWFAGRETSSIYHRGERDALVRCGVQLQPTEQKPKIRFGHAKPTRTHRAS